MKLRERFSVKLICVLLFMLSLAGCMIGGVFLIETGPIGSGQDAWFYSTRNQETMLQAARAVCEYHQVLRDIAEDGTETDSRQLRLEELAEDINLGGQGNFIWQLFDAEGRLLAENLGEGESLVDAAGNYPIQRQNVFEYADAGDGTRKDSVTMEVAYTLRGTMPGSDVYQTIRRDFAAVQQAFVPVLAAVIAAGVLCLFLFGFLVAAAGCRPGGERAALNPFDRVWLVVPLAALAFCVWLVGMAIASSDMVLLVPATVLAGGMLLATVLTIVRRARAKKLYETTLLYVLVRVCTMALRHIHLVVRIGGVFLLYIVTQLVLIIIIIEGHGGSGIAWFVWIMGNLSIIVLAVIVALQYSKIKKATEKMAQGDLGIVVNEKETPFFREMAHNLNSSGNAIKIAVEKSTHSERMKTELITNVSHDIKTPLTSIINYVGLLRTTKIEDPKALEYLDILEHKSKRLAQLMADLVEASKVTAGAVTVNMESLNLGELLKQASGEFESRFEERGIQLMCRLPEQPVLVYADGRHMWRVLDNLFGNAVKYALDGTRIYVDLADLGNEVVLSMKNISRDPLNMQEEELMERFVRGDRARVGEGSGLGLSIARSLMELQNGTMTIQIDGDLFKVILTLRKM